MPIKTVGVEKVRRILEAVEKIEPIKGVVSHHGAVSPSGRRYEDFVQAVGAQARVHQGRWQTNADAVTDNKVKIRSDFQREIRSIIRSGRGDLDTVMNRALKLLEDYMRVYPPARGRYQRTFRLRDGWFSEQL